MSEFESTIKAELIKLNDKLDRLFAVVQDASKRTFNEDQLIQDQFDKRFRDLYALIETLVRHGYLRRGAFASARSSSDIKYNFRYLRNELERDKEERKRWRGSIREEWQSAKEKWKDSE